MEEVGILRLGCGDWPTRSAGRAEEGPRYVLRAIGRAPSDDHASTCRVRSGDREVPRLLFGLFERHRADTRRPSPQVTRPDWTCRDAGSVAPATTLGVSG